MYLLAFSTLWLWYFGVIFIICIQYINIPIMNIVFIEASRFIYFFEVPDLY